MCLIAFAYKAHTKYDLILAANRDEFYGRPTRAAQFWDDHPEILAGKDLTAGGTWMGVNRSGRFAALTNYRDPSITRENPPTRGKIVLEYLAKESDPSDFLRALHTKYDQYMGFNVLTGTPETLFHYSNQEEKINRVVPGVHGLSNELLDSPWPKVERTKSDLQKLIHEKELNEEAIFDILKNDRPAPDDQLPDTGVSREIEKKISPVFIKSDDYGTRSSTILLIDKNRHVIFEERRYKNGTKQVDATNRFEFEIERV